MNDQVTIFYGDLTEVQLERLRDLLSEIGYKEDSEKVQKLIDLCLYYGASN